MFRRGLLILLLAASAGACSLFHRETPQQKMMDALNRGNGAEAVNIWQQMSPKDRMKFNLGQGIKPAVPPKEVARMLSQMPPDQIPKQITVKAPDVGGGGLQELPQIINAQPTSPVQSAPQSEQQSEQP